MCGADGREQAEGRTLEEYPEREQDSLFLQSLRLWCGCPESEKKGVREHERMHFSNAVHQIPKPENVFARNKAVACSGAHGRAFKSTPICSHIKDISSSPSLLLLIT